MSGLQEIAPAGAEPVSLTTLKTHLRVTTSDEDDLISIYAQAAREDVEDFLRRSLVSKTFVQSLDSFPYYTDSMLSQMAYPPAYYSLPRYSTTLWNYSQMIELLVSPLQEVLGIDYTGTDGNTHTLEPVLENWQANYEYEVDDEIEDSNGNVQVVTAVAEPAPGSDTTQEVTSGANPPTWNAALNGTTTDGPLTWTNKGAAPASGFFYDRITEPPRLFPAPAGAFWPPVLYVPNAVRIRFVGGYGTDGKGVPARAKAAIMAIVANLYENREPVGSPELKKIPYHVERMLWSLRVINMAGTRG